MHSFSQEPIRKHKDAMIVADVQDRRTTSQAGTDYALGYTNAEQERLIRQAAIIAPIAERLFRGAGIGPGQRVFDLGSGMGDVAMLVARLVGPSGEVVGVEQDANSIARAKARATVAGLHNISFLNSDVNNIAAAEPFDAAVDRFILMYLPDPVSVLRSVGRLIALAWAWSRKPATEGAARSEAVARQRE